MNTPSAPKVYSGVSSGVFSGLNLNNARRAVAQQFERGGLADCEGEARELVMAATKLTRAELIVQGPEPLSPKAAQRLEDYTARRLAGEPVDNILGWRDFYGRRFKVTKDVLSPRQETEEVTARALALIKDIKAPRVLDLGTGSGAIITTILAERADASGAAADISQAALDIAASNAASHGVAERLTLIRSDWFSAISQPAPNEAFDLIVSNPPYIDSAAMGALETEVKQFDPALALHGGEDGLEPYRQIAARAGRYMTGGGALVFEIGFDQGQSVAEILQQAGFINIETTQDIFGQPRIVCAQSPEKKL